MKRTFAVTATWGIELFTFHRWFGCWLFSNEFYFTKTTLTATLTDATNADIGIPLFIVRAFHNKVLALGWGLLQTLLQYWDIRFLEEFIGIIGAIGVGFGIWYFFTKDRKNILLYGLFSLGILLPLIELYFQPNIRYSYVLYAFGFLFQTISLYGIWRFLEKGRMKRYLLITALVGISFISLILFPSSYQTLCLKI